MVASRLAAADPGLRILVIEAGPPTLEDFVHVQPARFLSHLGPGSITAKFNVGKESAELGGRIPVVPCGQCLGGGSSINCECTQFVTVFIFSLDIFYVSYDVLAPIPI